MENNNINNEQNNIHHTSPIDSDLKAESPKKKIINKKNLIFVVIVLGFVILLIISVVSIISYVNSMQKSAVNNTESAETSLIQGSEIPDSINPVDVSNLPLGVNKYTSSGPKKGYVYSCQAQFGAGAGGADVAGPWINEIKKTWNSKQKVVVSGNVTWPNASYKISIDGQNRIISANNLPINNQTTGIYPIQKSDLAYQYDKNPNSISSQNINWSLPLSPTELQTPKCLNMGAIGILEDGVVLFNALDGEGRDAAAYETLDSCEGHPERTSEYHHHNIASCIISKYNEPNSSSLVGYAIDGFGIYVERDKNGNLLTNENLDECHGRTSEVMWDGKKTTMYHYNATYEYPYTVGCFKATPAVQTTESNLSNKPPVRPIGY